MAIMTVLRAACLFPAAAWALQAFTKSGDMDQAEDNWKPGVLYGECKPRRKEEISKCQKRMPPNLLFIGQAHSGSSSLSALMDLHPHISQGDTKEHHFFNRDLKLERDKSAGKFAEYTDQFCVDCNTTVTFDATMEYINLATEIGKKGVEKVRKVLGKDLKIMMMLRDPVDLYFSKECQGKKHTVRPFHPKDPPTVNETELSVTSALTIWQKIFPDRKNWLFVNSEDFFADQRKVLSQVFEFLGVEPVEIQMNAQNNHGEQMKDSGRRRCTMKANPIERSAYWSVKANVEDQKTLEKLTKLKFAWKRS